ncbi:MAG: hypothetical protein HY821_00275 [Acidobacteria bacterium]|nr:hypothetical protein [Acidobacteriota bacterium]
MLVQVSSMSGVAKKFLQTVVPGIIKPLLSLWNEMLGFLFLVFGLVLVRPVWRSYQEMASGDPAHIVKFLLSAFFCATMLGFGIHAFWKARKISRS